MANIERLLAGRKAVDAYRTAHTQLCSNGWYAGISEAHTPLLEKMLAVLKKQSFNSLDDFFDAGEKLKDGWR